MYTSMRNVGIQDWITVRAGNRQSGWVCKYSVALHFIAEVLCPGLTSQVFNTQPDLEEKMFLQYFTISCLRPKLSDFGTLMKYLSAALG